MIIIYHLYIRNIFSVKNFDNHNRSLQVIPHCIFLASAVIFFVSGLVGSFVSHLIIPPFCSLHCKTFQTNEIIKLFQITINRFLPLMLLGS